MLAILQFLLSKGIQEKKLHSKKRKIDFLKIQFLSIKETTAIHTKYEKTIAAHEIQWY